MQPTVHELLQEDCDKVFNHFNNPSILKDLDGAAIFITGGSGFIGSWICEFLSYLKRHHDIKTKLYILARDKQRFESRTRHLENLDLEFIRCDVRHLAEIPRDVNYVIHAAATPDNRFYMTNPLEAMTTIAEGTAAVLKAADRVSDLRMMVYLSSGSVYGTQPENLQSIAENHPLAAYSLDSVKSAYTEAKRYAEVLCASARSELRLPVVVLRPFTFLGPFQSLDAPWAINNFIQDGLMNRPIRVLGDGKAVRGFLYGADAAFWVLKALVSGTSGEVYNLGSGVGYTLEEIARKVAQSFQPVQEIVLNASIVPNISQNRYLADVSKLYRDFGLYQSTDLDAAIKRTVSWYKVSI